MRKHLLSILIIFSAQAAFSAASRVIILNDVNVRQDEESDPWKVVVSTSVTIATGTMSIAGHVDTSSTSVYGLGRFDTSGSSITSYQAPNSTYNMNVMGTVQTLGDTDRKIYHSRNEYNDLAISSVSATTIWSASNTWFSEFITKVSTRGITFFADFDGTVISSMNVGRRVSEVQADSGADFSGWHVSFLSGNDVTITRFSPGTNSFFNSITIRAIGDASVAPVLDGWSVGYFSTSTAQSGP